MIDIGTLLANSGIIAIVATFFWSRFKKMSLANDVLRGLVDELAEQQRAEMESHQSTKNELSELKSLFALEIQKTDDAETRYDSLLMWNTHLEERNAKFTKSIIKLDLLTEAQSETIRDQRKQISELTGNKK